MSASDLVRQLRFSLERMLPSEVGSFADRIKDCEESFEYPEEEEYLSSAITRRRDEFIAGRRCARVALARIGIEPCALMPDEDRSPQWPVGVVGSISHTAGLCCAVAAHTDTIACMGVDIEATTRISQRVIERVSHPLEADFVRGDRARGSLIFSAKEAFFKAQFPRWRARPGFGDLAFRMEPESCQLKPLEITDHWPPELRFAAVNMQFRYAFLDDYVLTLCWLGRAYCS